ncbi:MAG: TIGR00730 family Rossman fold protein [Candidatus Pacebacteria bacterium]|nr:TIGR00730 family Rossman fold protein [Candidatus Paceibacterota bacterium]
MTDKHPLGPNEDLYKINRDEKSIICKPEIELKGLHRMDLQMRDMLENKSDHCAEELLAGFIAISQYPKTVTIFGSARVKDSTDSYKQAKYIAGKICKEGFAVLTGGGPGIMEAANRGATEACGYSLGFNINLPFEQSINQYVTHGLDFDFFSARKMSMFFSAEAYLYFPGGFGTLDELFQLLTLIQTKKAPPTPIILIGSEYWNSLNEFIKNTLLNDSQTISPEDLNLYTITDDVDEILKIINNAPDREHY